MYKKITIIQRFVQYCIYIVKQFCSASYAKAISMLALAAITSSAEFFFNLTNKDALIALFVLILFDAISAIHRAYKTDYEIQSRKMVKTAVKIVMYMLLVSAGHFADVAIVGSGFIELAVISWLAATEILSIFENFGKAGYKVPQSLLNQIRKTSNGK